MKILIAYGVLGLVITSKVTAQLCPGGGVSFASAATFLQSWTSTCASGTSCTGGVEFDNRIACEPTTAMDGCAPAPSCTAATNGSDLWYKFYATGTSATIHVIQNVSFVAAIQVFSGGPTCGALSEVGCVVAGGPSGGVTLNLLSLTAGNLYYFRVFGSASSSAQRTGTFCFCGSAGLGSSALPVTLTSFKAIVENNKVRLVWHTASEANSKSFEVQQSMDGNDFATIAVVPGKGTTSLPSDYSFVHANPLGGINYYRLKQVNIDNSFQYSEVVTARINSKNLISLYPNPVSERLTLESSVSATVVLANEAGQRVRLIRVMKGRNEISVSKLPPGIYFLSVDNLEIGKFNVIR
jgi:hypothetical protein